MKCFSCYPTILPFFLIEIRALSSDFKLLLGGQDLNQIDYLLNHCTQTGSWESVQTGFGPQTSAGGQVAST